ncbi:MAG: TetR/AcrR family transcriptional regulator [Pseudomonadota bacterium]
MTAKPTTERRGAPHQERSRETVELILSAAAELLEEVGFEKISTNQICKRAKLTPPALYRYFPNKYAVLKELGERLMARQNALLRDRPSGDRQSESFESQIKHLLAETIRVTRETPAGGWIMRSLHATPILADVRRRSHRDMARLLTEQSMPIWPGLNANQAFTTNRMNIELGYALVEMVFDEPELDEQELIRQTASMMAHNIELLLGQAKTGA